SSGESTNFRFLSRGRPLIRRAAGVHPRRGMASLAIRQIDDAFFDNGPGFWRIGPRPDFGIWVCDSNPVSKPNDIGRESASSLHNQQTVRQKSPVVIWFMNRL